MSSGALVGVGGSDLIGSKGLTSLTSGVVGAAAVAELAAAAQRLLDAGAGRGRLAEVADGIGTPDPHPRNLVSCPSGPLVWVGGFDLIGL